MRVSERARSKEEGRRGLTLVVKMAEARPYSLIDTEEGRSAEARKLPDSETADVRSVGLGDSVSLVGEGGDSEDGSEDLLVVNLHAGLDVGEDGGLDEVTVLQDERVNGQWSVAGAQAGGKGGRTVPCCSPPAMSVAPCSFPDLT